MAEGEFWKSGKPIMDESLLEELARKELSRPKWVVPTLAILLSIVGFFLVLTLQAEEGSESGSSSSQLPGHSAYIAAQYIALGIAVICFPFALKHDVRELTERQGIPGPRRAMIATVIICAVAFSGAVIPLLSVTVISMMARKHSAWTWLAGGVFLASAYGDMLLSEALGYTEQSLDRSVWYEIGRFSFPILLMSPFVLIGLQRGKRRFERWRLMQEARMAVEQVEQQRKVAQREERSRIARDMHDSLSHRLSLIAVHSGAMTFRRDLDLTAVESAAATIREQAEAAVSDLRMVLTALNDDASLEDDPRISIEQLVDQARAAGEKIDLDLDGAPGSEEIPLLSLHALHRVVQECLTNARKHAPGQVVTMRATRLSDAEKTKRDGGSLDSGGEGADWYWLRISNSLRAEQMLYEHAPLAADSAHLGLTGLAERVKLSGGSFEVIQETGSFTVEVMLPLTSTRQNLPSRLSESAALDSVSHEVLGEEDAVAVESDCEDDRGEKPRRAVSENKAVEDA